MKSAIKTFLVIVAIATTTHIAIAQTPYDDFAPSNKKKEMLKLPEVKFRVANSDSTNNSNYLLFDKENNTLTYHSKNDSIINIFALSKAFSIIHFSLNPTCLHNFIIFLFSVESISINTFTPN
jgi:hypothetical protein